MTLHFLHKQLTRVLLLAIISFVVLLPARAAYPSPPIRVTGVEIQEAAADSAIIRIQTDRPIGRYEAFPLSKPPRLVIDIEDAFLAERTPTEQAGKGSIKRIRSSQYRREPKPVVRVVLELGSTLPYKAEGIPETGLILIGKAVAKAPPVPPQPPTAPAEKPKPAPEVAQAPKPEQPSPQPPTPVEPERPKPEKPREALLLERGAILLPQGTLQLEPSFEYSRFSTDRVAISGFTIFEAIVIGTIRVDRLNRDILTGALAFRYGLLDRVQLDGRVPYLYRRDEEVLGVGTGNERERTIENIDIGDVEASISWQALIGQDAVPDVILRGRARFPTGKDPFEIPTETVGPGEVRLTEPPTGSGFYGAGPGVTLVWRSDPVVFFVGGSYLFNLERNVGGGFGKINPGNSLEWIVGLNVALSERVAVNISFVDQITDDTEQGGRDVPGTSFNDGRLVLGASVSLSPNITLLVSAGAGLTEESPDFTFTISLPITFKLF